MYYFTKPVIFIFPTVTALEKHILLSNLYSFLLDRTEWIRYLFIRKARCACLPLGDRLSRYGVGGTNYQKGSGGCALAQTEERTFLQPLPHPLRGALSQRGPYVAFL